MLTCKQFDEFMVDFLDRELPFAQRASCWMHLKLCRNCAKFVRQYEETIALGKQAFGDPDNPVPDTVPEDLINAAVARQRKARPNS